MRKSKGKSYRTLTNKGDVHPYKCMDYTCVDGKIYAQPATKGRYKVTEETDEEGCAILKFYNQNGQLVLSRKVVGKDEYSTYYIYDPWGNLCVIAPPSTNGGIGNGTDIETSHLLHLYAFIYKYDGSHRCIYKKMPACDPIYYVYDKAGKLIFSQDGNQRERGEWSFSIPDIFGREAIGGVCKNEIDYLAEPLGNTVVTASFANTEEFTDYIGHKIEGVELRTAKLHSAKFYDDYSFVGSLGIPTVLGYQTPGDGYGVKYDDSKGRLTGSMSPRSRKVASSWRTTTTTRGRSSSRLRTTYPPQT